jgi:hypothetical protein
MVLADEMRLAAEAPEQPERQRSDDRMAAERVGGARGFAVAEGSLAGRTSGSKNPWPQIEWNRTQRPRRLPIFGPYLAQ